MVEYYYLFSCPPMCVNNAKHCMVTGRVAKCHTFLKIPRFSQKSQLKDSRNQNVNKQETSGTRISGKAGNLENFLATLVTG